MPKFSPEDKVWYIPDHADGPGHRDAEIGIVKSEELTMKPPGYYVNYPNDDSNVYKLTYEQHLEPREG